MDIEGFVSDSLDVRKASSKFNRRAELWDDAHDRIHREYPSTVRVTAKSLPMSGLLQLLGDLHTFAINDGTSSDPRATSSKRGARPPATPEQITDTVHSIFIAGLGVGMGPPIEREYTSLPFLEAFYGMIGERTLVQMARRTDIEIKRMQRIASGKYPPTGDEMAAIASTFGKEPWYFREVRSTMIAAAVLAQMDENPHQSARIVKEMAS